jgi:predicted nucleic acid-binding protein
MIILDTSALIEITKGSEKGAQIVSHIQEESYATTSINMHELLLLARSDEKKEFKEFLNAIKIYPYDRDCVEKSVFIERELMQKGKLINKLDILIASICLAQGAGILTLDEDFKRIPGLKAIII